MANISQINGETLKKCLEDGSRILLDVRTNEEYQAGHLPSVHIPLQELPNRFQELNSAQPYAVICAGGVRSMQAASLLTQAGFEDIANVEGGMKGLA